ncbi:RNA-directed DNA polymerase [Curtobacterium citreum]|uniref:RNA-directed DNA polymerase n=1 Tax=Curtobacterium citreum TaxID=2036 RepID=UPI002542C753|nr:RNA-directed DNA polymerase [Curtobacterium citreum]WIJ46990.1 RNA-directed DNA polymerase [Curtobacterium citreum]
MLGARGRRVSKFGSRFIASADINSFYPSLYSHSLPWALVGKAHAKVNRSLSDWFNQFDLRVRECRRGETVGVAVGPGTSAIAAEVVLNAIDKDPSLKKFRYERFIDDYSLHATSREEAEEFLMALSGALRSYNLHLNPRKTRIEELPLPKTPGWIRELKAAARHVDTKNLQDVLDFLDLAIEVTQAKPDASALKYALAALEKRLIKPHPPMQSNSIARALLSLSFHRPVALPFLVRFVQKSKVKLSVPMARHVDELLVHHSLSRRTDAVTWLLYLVQKQGLTLRRGTEKAILESEDCLSLVLLWHVGSARAKDDVEDFAKALIPSTVDDYERDQYWLLLFELQLARKIKRPYGANDNDFKTLIDSGVRFVDFGTRLKAPPRMSSSSPYSITE